MATLQRSELAALARKYRLLAELRRAPRDARDPRPPMRQLARLFPGALRELDQLPLESIDERLAALERALLGGEPQPWMEWMRDYHREWRLAKAIKRRLSGRRAPRLDEVCELAQTVAREIGAPCDLELVVQVAHPPAGRIDHVELQRLSARFAVSVELLKRSLFPERV